MTFIFSLVLVFNHDFFIYIDIARIGTSNAAADDVTNKVTHKIFNTLCVFGVERSTSDSARRTSRVRKIGAWCICDARKARPAGPSPHLGCVFVQSHRKRRMARPEGPSRFFGYCSFVEERRSSGEACRAEPTSAFLVASDQKRQILALVVSP